MKILTEAVAVALHTALHETNTDHSISHYEETDTYTLTFDGDDFIIPKHTAWSESFDHHNPYHQVGLEIMRMADGAEMN